MKNTATITGLAISVAVLYPAVATATPHVCESAAVERSIELSYGRDQDADLGGEGDSDVRVRSFGFRYRPGYRRGGIAVGVGHRYDFFDIGDFPERAGESAMSGPEEEPPEPQTNGHHHTLYLPVDLSPGIGGDWTLRLMPALSVSSSILKDPQRIDSESLQLGFGALRRVAGPAGGQWQVGLCGDHRFGDYRVYPAIAWLDTDGDIQWRLGFPDTELTLRLRQDWMTGLRLQPHGNRWRILDNDTHERSFFTREAWLAEWHLQWRPARWSLTWRIGRIFDTDYEFLLDNGQRVSTGADAAWRMELGIALRL